MSVQDEDAKLKEFGYTQKLDRSVGKLASFCIGFAVISATTAVFSGFGFGIATAGPAFLWTFPIAAAVFFLWAVIAGDLAAKMPLAGYAYQWTSRLVGPRLALFTGFTGALGFISGFTGVAYVMALYMDGLFGFGFDDRGLILLTMAIVVFCGLINMYGVRLATALNNAGVALELVVTILVTLFVAVFVLLLRDNHQPLSYLFETGGEKKPYIVAWLTSSLGCIFGLLGVEAAADIAEETKDARRVIPRTMLYALGVSAAAEFAMYIVYTLSIPRGVDITESNSPIETILTIQVGETFAKFVVAIALTNILVCVLANMLVATRLVYSMARDNMLPGSHQLAIVKPGHKSPVYAVIAATGISLVILGSALFNAQAFSYIIGMSSLGYFGVYVFTTAGLIFADRKGKLPATEPGLFDLGKLRRPLHILGLVIFSAVLAALLLLPDFRQNGYVYLGFLALCGLWYLFVVKGRLERHEAGPNYAARKAQEADEVSASRV